MRVALPASTSGNPPFRVRRSPPRGPAPVRGLVPGSGAPGSGQLIVELATNGDVDGLRALLDTAYGGSVGSTSTLDSSTKAIVGAQLRTAGQRAAHAGQSATLELLLAYGCDLGLGFGNGRCIHVEAAARGHSHVLEVLLTTTGASIETQNGYGRTCLLEAAREGHVQCVAVALEHGADVNFRTKNANVTAAMFAAANGHAECFNFLRNYDGCDLTVQRTLDGKTAMQIHMDVVKNEMKKVTSKE